VAFDELDRRIVAALVEDGRATYADMGAKVGLSAPAVKRRVDRLRASGAITGFSVTVDPRRLGWTTEAYVELFCRGRTSPSDIAAAVSKYPEVTGAATITGEADALLHIRAADVRHFEEVVEHISAEPFVVRTKSVIVLSRLVSRAGFGPVGSQPPGAGQGPVTEERAGGSGGSSPRASTGLEPSGPGGSPPRASGGPVQSG
jgi:DNA-binding Lrp family transcriptional regulator